MDSNTINARATDPENEETQRKPIAKSRTKMPIKNQRNERKLAYLNILPFNSQFAVALSDHVENVKKGITNR